MKYISALYRFYKKEINTNIFIILLGLCFIIVPLIIYGNINAPMSVILVSIGCSIFATGLTVLLSLFYKDSKNRLYECLESVGLMNVLFEEDIYRYLPERIQNSQKIIYYSTNGLPLYFIKNNINSWKQAINDDVEIRIVLGICTTNEHFDRHGGNDYEEFLQLLLDLGIQCKEVDFSVNHMLIIDNMVWDIFGRIKKYPTRIMEYMDNNQGSNFYNYQYKMFCESWNAGKYISQ